tara:strand:+ start:91 stop:705 length:615 start_codon:yes stop_codon:yes gene_type:complete
MSSGPSHFVVMATGQIEGAKFEGHDSLYCRYAFSMGEDWTVMKGVEEGITQLSSASGASAEGGQVAVWNFPIDVTFRSTCAHGWPQIIVSVYGTDAFGRSDMILGYGAIHLPIAPGRHELYVNTFRPLASSLIGRLQSWLSGMRPEFIDSLFPSKSQGRDVTRVQSFGTVKLVLDVTLQGLETLGYATVSQQTVVRLSSPFGAR